MNELKFNSQICTTKEQSQRLLELGLKPETADMYIFDDEVYIGKPNVDDIPAWSLHRLIEICNKTQFGMTISIYNNKVTFDGDFLEVFDNTYDNPISVMVGNVQARHWVFDNTYDNLISVIEWLIKRGHLNKEYLKQ